MIGYAQQALEEGGLFFLTHQEAQKGAFWPLLAHCLQLKTLSPIDYALARALVEEENAVSEPLACLLCHLSLASRQGHLCVEIANGNITPDPRKLWAESEETEAVENIAALLEQVHRKIVEGSQEAFRSPAVRQYHNLYYLQRFWAFEELVIQGLKPLLSEPPAQPLAHESLTREIKELVDKGALLEKQALAIAAVENHRLTIITGGPGTGKTYTAALLIKLLWHSLSAEKKVNFQIALAAPTGKAAANLQASIQKSIAAPDFPVLSAKTLHSLLGIKGAHTSYDNHRSIAADLLLVDESSMIDIRMMCHLLNAVKPGARIILLGDRDQLPSVEAGSLFADLIQMAAQKKYPGLVELTTCVRAEKKELVTFAEAIKKGDVSTVRNFFSGNLPHSCISRLHFNENRFHQQLLEYVKPYFVSNDTSNPSVILQTFTVFRILTPLRKGPLGVENINKFLANALQAKANPIMLTQNDYRMDLFNGEIGVLVKDPAGDYALFLPKGEEQAYRKISALLLPNYELAYCISVHKSQGSEFDHVLMLVPKGAEVLGREVFYTAATRARRKLDIWGEDETVDKTLAVQCQRLSGISNKMLA